MEEDALQLILQSLIAVRGRVLWSLQELFGSCRELCNSSREELQVEGGAAEVDDEATTSEGEGEGYERRGGRRGGYERRGGR